MKLAKILHNPSAGGRNITAKQLVELVERENFRCTYASVKHDEWKTFGPELDFIIVAGGDGTVRKAAQALLDREDPARPLPIAVLPVGTVNNIARTLQISGPLRQIVKSWHRLTLKKFDIGKLHGPSDERFFLEGFGYGVFPRLMKEVKKMNGTIANAPVKKIPAALGVLYDIILGYASQYAEIHADGVKQSDRYALIEVMNIRSIGPDLRLARSADPGDGKMEIVTVPESRQSRFADYILNCLKGKKDDFTFDTLRATEFRILCNNKDMHADDKIVENRAPGETGIQVSAGAFELLVPRMAKQAARDLPFPPGE